MEKIMSCCVNQKGYQNCRQCERFPCSHYENDDPTKAQEENAADHCMQMKNKEEYRKAAHIELLIGMLAVITLFMSSTPPLICSRLSIV